ncbi:MAG TPA: hypothetical protein VMB66_01945 [Candidatus Acidoferrales bacterium]|nr:hypothetical protein [Candidatus Acidoferrales bacterium]
MPWLRTQHRAIVADSGRNRPLPIASATPRGRPNHSPDLLNQRSFWKRHCGYKYTATPFPVRL